MPYPTEFPLSDAKLLISVLTGNKPSLKELHSAFYNVWGYVANQFFGSDSAVWSDVNYDALTTDEVKALCADQLKNVTYQFDIPGVVSAVNVDWRQLFSLLLKVLPLILLENQ